MSQVEALNRKTNTAVANNTDLLAGVKDTIIFTCQQTSNVYDRSRFILFFVFC